MTENHCKNGEKHTLQCLTRDEKSGDEYWWCSVCGSLLVYGLSGKEGVDAFDALSDTFLEIRVPSER